MVPPCRLYGRRRATNQLKSDVCIFVVVVFVFLIIFEGDEVDVMAAEVFAARTWAVAAAFNLVGLFVIANGDDLACLAGHWAGRRAAKETIECLAIARTLDLRATTTVFLDDNLSELEACPAK